MIGIGYTCIWYLLSCLIQLPFNLSDLSDVDKENQFESTIKIIEDLGIEYASPQDCANVAYVCSVVSTRAAFLCAAGKTILQLTLSGLSLIIYVHL